MSRFLWRYYFQDDVDSFRELLDGRIAAGRTYTQRETAISNSKSFEDNVNGTSVSPSTSPILKGKTASQKDTDRRPANLGRGDINIRDGRGLTILHHAASSGSENAQLFAKALLAHPFIDLYIQDYENGWTALHRAFYFGNITIARAIIERDAPGLSTVTPAIGHLANLAKVKDKEGYGPYDLFSATIADRSLRTGLGSTASDDDGSSDGGQASGRHSSEHGDGDEPFQFVVPPAVNVRADELYTFGSNKNLTLGLNDQDDRHFPERIHLRRPHRLFERFYRQHMGSKISRLATANPAYAAKIQAQTRVREDTDLPDIIRYKPVLIQDVQMSKFHTVVLTTDPVANMYVCGHGPGGRLGTGNEKTLFSFTCLDDFGSARVSSVALGQDHTLAVTDRGEMYSWGSNAFGQLGCGLPKEHTKSDEAIQTQPKQIFGPMKKEVIAGVAASRIHSVAYTTTAVFTFGKNEGQLGLVDSQAGTLKLQSTPRQVAASRLSSNIHSVSAIDRATVILLENHEVHVFANYGTVKLNFPLEGFSNYFLQQGFLTTKYDKAPNKIVKITSGGDTICALSTSGEVFTVTVNQRLDPSSTASTSTTNPNKIRAALSVPHRAWTLRNDRTSARDVGVDADGSIILSTEAGGVFRRIRRPKATSRQGFTGKNQKSKEFKFARVPNLTRAVGVRASSSGAYCGFREDCNVTRTELNAGTNTLWQDVFSMFSLRQLANESPAPSFWQKPDAAKRVIERVSHSLDIENEVANVLHQIEPSISDADLYICSNSFEQLIPAHQVLLAGRSAVFRQAFAVFDQNEEYRTDSFELTYTDGGKLVLTFFGLDFLTVLELMLYMYTDCLVGFWGLRHQVPEMTLRYKQVRAELMRLGTKLELRNLEAAARKVITRPEPSLSADFELALLDPNFFANCDACIQLADGEVLAHSRFLSRRCPFFEGLFHGHASGKWISDRGDKRNTIDVDLSHIELHVFRFVLRYLYADTGQEMFDEVVTGNLDDFLDLVLEVLSVANELMLDELSRSCQAVLGRFVNTRNACQLLNAVAPSSVQDFKHATLEYLCLNLEPLLANHWLDELDEDLLEELDRVVQANQRAAAPIVRSGRLEAELHDKYPELAGMIIRAQQAKIDALEVKAKFPDAGSLLEGSLGKLRPSLALHARETANSSARRDSYGQVKTLSSPNLQPLPRPAQQVSLPELNRDHGSASTASLPRTTERPWGTNPFHCEKLDMKDIMAQTSTGRTSNLSLGLHSHPGSERRTSSSALAKASQRERKRQQQQSQMRSVSDQTSLFTPAAARTTSDVASPWKTASSSRQVSDQPSSSIAIPSPKLSSHERSPSPRTPTTPQLTMRQTIANAPAPKSSETVAMSPPNSKHGSRSASTPSSARTASVGKLATSSESPVMAIRSIRHQPRPEMPQDFLENQSLSDIMSREQAAKTNLQDAVAKRSLQEIQDEQAFQEWWEKESAAVQEAQRQQAGGNRRGRGNPQGRGHGRDSGRRGSKQRGNVKNVGSSSKS